MKGSMTLLTRYFGDTCVYAMGSGSQEPLGGRANARRKLQGIQSDATAETFMCHRGACSTGRLALSLRALDCNGPQVIPIITESGVTLDTQAWPWHLYQPSFMTE